MNIVDDTILLVDNLQDQQIPNNYEEVYFTHILCLEGKALLQIDNKIYSIEKNQIAILLPSHKINLKLLSNDYKSIYLLISFDLMSKNNPDIAWGIKGYMFSKENPVVTLDEKIVSKCLNNFYLLYEKYTDVQHRFRKEIVNLQLQMFVMDMWNIFADNMEEQLKNTVGTSLFQQFLKLVEIHCMQNRSVEFYAKQLYISPKYLSELCKKNSGKSASEWIHNFTTTRLILLLKNDSLTFTEIAESMNFSSLSFFSRYVKKMLGVPPTEYRNRVG